MTSFSFPPPPPQRSENVYFSLADTYSLVPKQGQGHYTKFVYSVISCFQNHKNNPDGKVHGANMGPIWGQQDPCGPHVDPMNFAIWEDLFNIMLIFCNWDQLLWHIWNMYVFQRILFTYYVKLKLSIVENVTNEALVTPTKSPLSF